METDVTEETVSKIYKYKALPVYNGLPGRIPVKNKDVYVGVELEIENVEMKYPPISSFKQTDDGSLKVNGMEFVSIPIKMKYLEVELRRVLGTFEEGATLSNRCSIHVHVNARDMTQENLMVLVLLYTIFERTLFRASGDRWGNIFCHPLQASPVMVSEIFTHDIRYWHWQKYSALNLCPVMGKDGQSAKIGTVEFRQMHGSLDVEEIMQWCNLLTALKRAAQEITLDDLYSHIQVMNTSSGYGWLAKEVFGSYYTVLTQFKEFVEDTERGIAFCKYVLPARVNGVMPRPEKPKEKKSIFSSVEPVSISLDDLVNAGTVANSSIPASKIYPIGTVFPGPVPEIQVADVSYSPT
jgi:hypothetical protein